MKHILVFLLVIYNSLSFAKEYNFVVKSGDTLGKYFKKAKLSQSTLMNLLASSGKAKKLNSLNIGKKLNIVVENKKFITLNYDYNSRYNLVINQQFVAKFVKKTQTNKYNTKNNNIQKYTFKISKNLFYDGKNAGLRFSQIQLVVKELQKYIDFSKLRKNNVFQVYFRGSKLLAIKFDGKKTIQLFNWKKHFYSQNANISYDMFLKAPLKYKHISSGFTYKRFHPILKKYLPHRAIDYAANKGAKVRATASGVVVEKRYHNALGNFVKIKHNYGYLTVYAHLWKFANINIGDTVKQGQIVGFVGSTGRSTGNHLHYELRHGKKYLNPLKYRPKLHYRLKGAEFSEFKKYIQQFN